MQQHVASQKESDSKVVPISGERSCIHCYRTMPDELFHFHKVRGKYGNVCLDCRREQRRGYNKDYNRAIAEAQYVKRLPGQLEASLRKTVSLLRATERYGCPLEREAQLLLETIYGKAAPGQRAEIEYRLHDRRKSA